MSEKANNMDFAYYYKFSYWIVTGFKCRGDKKFSCFHQDNWSNRYDFGSFSVEKDR